MSRNVYSTLAEKKLLELLKNIISGSSSDHKSARFEGLEELQRRIKLNTIEKNKVIRILRYGKNLWE